MLEETLYSHEDPSFCYYSGLPSPAAYMKPVSEEGLSREAIDRIIEMAWEDRTPFDAIRLQFGLNEQEVRNLMKAELRFSSYVRWRKRVEACSTKHYYRRNKDIRRFRSAAQRLIG